MEWKANYSCNNEVIDEQHKRLFEVGNHLYTVAMNKNLNEQMEQVKVVFQKLKMYTVEHFSYEEQLMLSNECQGYEKHKEEHNNFIIWLKEMEQDFLYTSEMIVEMILYFMDWIVSHILVVDKMCVK